MKLYILRPRENNSNWEPWYDKTFGVVVRASSVKEAREIASTKGHGDEGSTVWLTSKHVICEELKQDGEAGIILKDFASA